MNFRPELPPEPPELEVELEELELLGELELEELELELDGRELEAAAERAARFLGRTRTPRTKPTNPVTAPTT